MRKFSFVLIALLTACSGNRSATPAAFMPAAGNSVGNLPSPELHSQGTTVVSCKVVTPAKRTVLNPPPSETFTIPSSIDPSSHVFYFEIGQGGSCASTTAIYATVPGAVGSAKRKVNFGQGHGTVVLKKGTPYVYLAYALPASPAKYIYVIDHSNDNVAVFDASASGDVAPIRLITNVGGTGGAPQGIAEDVKGDLYVTVTLGSSSAAVGEVLVFAPGAKGNATPIRTIAGSRTTLNVNSSDTGAAADGSVYVNNGSSIAVFRSHASGNVAPERTITGLNSAGAAVSSTNLLYTANQIGKNANALEAFAPTANGNAKPQSTIVGSNTHVGGNLTAVDGLGNVYQAPDTVIVEFASFQQGNAFPIRYITGSRPKFVGLQPIAVDGAGNLFVGDESKGRIYRFAPSADRNPVPLAVIEGKNTGLKSPAAMAVGP